MNALRLPEALTDIWDFIGSLNKYIDLTEPWILARDEENKKKLAGVMYHLAEGLRIVSVLLIPFIEDTAMKIQNILGIEDETLVSWDSIQNFGKNVCGLNVKKTEPIFPRIDVKKELEELEKISDNRDLKKQKNTPKKQEPAAGVITYDEFMKVELKIGKVKEAEAIEGSEKLIKMQVQIGEESRQIVSGIRQWYSPEEMVGKTIIVVANLKPAKLFGILSEGMLLAAESDGVLKLVTIEGDLPSGVLVR
jgi:methionyl-tRNA synthetase